MEHKVADPGPLGLAGFAMTTFCLSSWNANLWHGAGLEAALSLALFYGGIVQLFAGMWEFVRKNTFGALAFSSYGAFWLAFYAIVQFHLAGGGTDTVGIFLLGWTIFTAYMTIAAARTNTAIFVVFILLLVTFVLLTIGAFQSSANITKAVGWVGVATAAAAWYASFAGVVNETFKKAIIPTIPLAPGSRLRRAAH